MGRRKKYQTKEEIRISNNEKAMKYYWKNVELIRQKNLKRYYENVRKLNEEMSKSK